MGLVELVGRHYFLELRRLILPVQRGPRFSVLHPCHALPCPWPARDPHLLSQVYCHKGLWQGHGTSLLRAKGERAYVVEPNLRETHWTLLQPSVQLSPQSALACQEMPS